MFNLNQWVTWDLVQREGKAKPDKIPCGGKDPHDSRNWLPLSFAESITDKVGFVLTENDPYFCIDIDHALQENGQWSNLAIEVCNLFPGAYMEVSYSGDGLHIFAQGKLPEDTKHKNSALGLEVYDNLRYIAVTRINCNGTPDINYQTNLDYFVDTYMGKSTTGDVHLNWTTQPRSDWNGPDDDDELINKMLNARPSANALWGGAATISDLWYCNKQAFIECYSDGNNWYDESLPDMALASHLAFWTGCNCERMERLMWRSGLVREKWTKHKTYLRELTIVKAAASTPNVYNDQSIKPVDTTNSAVKVRQGLQYLTPDAQIEHFKGCVYVINTHRILRPNGTLITPEQFKVVYGGFEFAMDAQNLKTTKCSWEAFSKSRVLEFPVVEGVLFRPEIEPGTIINQDGLDYINSYQPIPIRTIKGDCNPFLDLIYKLFPNETDRNIILSYMAAIVQYKGIKFQWCPLIQGSEGNGKSFLMRSLMYAIGDRHSHLVNPKDIGNKFNAWIEGKIFAGVEEVYVSDKRDLIDVLKIMITNDRIEIQPKGGNQYTGDNRVNFMMNSNHKDAIKKTRNDRRYATFFTPQQSYDDIINSGMGGDYFPNLYSWARRDGYAIIADYLANYRIPDEYNPATKCHRAPITSTTNMAIDASQGPVEQEIENAIGEQLQGFRNGWISATALDELLKKTGKARLVHRNMRAEILAGMGYMKAGRSTIEIPREGGRPVLYKAENVETTGDIAFDYMKAQGYITP